SGSAGTARGGGPPLEENRPRPVVGDQGGAGDAHARPQPLAPISRAGYRTGLAEVHRCALRRLRLPLRWNAREPKARALADGGEPHVDDLDRLVGGVVRIAPVV